MTTFSKPAPLALIIGTALTVSACGDRDPASEPTPSAMPDTEATASIFSPEVDPEGAQQVMQPLESSIGFPDGGAELDAAAIAALEEVKASDQLAQGGPIILRGHSDAGGNDAVNMRASTSRAEAVKDWLTSEGVVEDRITVIAFGEQNPAQPNANPDGTPNEEGRAANRRVDITIAVRGTSVDDAATQDPAAADEEPEERPARKPLIPLVD